MPNITLPLQISVSVTETDLADFARVALKLVEESKPVEPRFNTAKERSRHSMLGGKQSPTDLGLLLDNNEAAKLLKLSEKTLYTMRREKRMPEPMKFGMALRWRHDELKAWIDAGCPPQSEWKYQPNKS